MSFRARAIDAKQLGAPAEDVPRLARPANYFPGLQFARDAYSPQAAHGGMVFAKTLGLQGGRARPASRCERSIHQDDAESPSLPDRASGALEEVVKITDHAKADCSRAVFGHHVMAFKFQGWYLGVAKQLCEQLAPLSSGGPKAVDRWLKQLFVGDWPCPLSCKGREGVSPPGRESKPAQQWCSAPGCPACRRHVVSVIRGVTQLARRLKLSDNPSCDWALRATRSSDESRPPFEKRRSEPATARRLVRGHPDADGSADYWPGDKAELRPEAPRPDGDPQAEPSSSARPGVALKKSASAHAKKGESSKEFHSPPPRVEGRLNGKDAQALPHPLRDLGLNREEVRKLHGGPEAAGWWGENFQLGRAPFDSKYCAVWHALSESFAPA